MLKPRFNNSQFSLTPRGKDDLDLRCDSRYHGEVAGCRTDFGIMTIECASAGRSALPWLTDPELQ
jgi:hypothetical protein